MNYNKLIYFISITLLLLYGIFTVYNTAQNMGVAGDEEFNRYVGTVYLKFKNLKEPEIYRDHPAFSMWIQYLPAHLSNIETPFLYRLYNLILYSLAGFIFAFLLWRDSHPISALIFASFYATEPTLKAMSSLNNNDSGMALYIGITTLLLWSLWKKSKSELGHTCYIIRSIFAAFLFGIAINSKLSAGLLLPFYFVIFIFIEPLFFNFNHNKHSKYITKIIDLLFLSLVGLSTIYLSYFFIPDHAFYIFRKSVKFQLASNNKGHIGFIFGNYSYYGFWYFFLALYLLKTPIIHLLTTCFGWGLTFSKISSIKNYYKEIFCFFLPALFIGIFLSRGNLHAGYRYCLPAILLLLLGCSITFKDFLLKSAYKRLIVFVVIFSSMATDINTFLRDDFISSFNIFTPTHTRNFCDSNNHWFQDVSPKFSKWKERAVPFYKLDFANFLKNTATNDRKLVYLGASELCGIGAYPFSVSARAFPPGELKGAHEFISISPLELFLVLSHYPYPRDPVIVGGQSINIHPLNFEQELINEGKGPFKIEHSNLLELASRNSIKLQLTYDPNNIKNYIFRDYKALKFFIEKNTTLKPKEILLTFQAQMQTQGRQKQKFLLVIENFPFLNIKMNQTSLIQNSVQEKVWNTFEVSSSDNKLEFKISYFNDDLSRIIKSEQNLFWLKSL
ncbi:MAG: hypothetical protein HQK49_00680 [Oligoflexia bacterium]|nr:hypothetical protein [Oligoflexia bacterium]